jgi:glycosyltransferase involved in cell wall biosynthesis
VTISVITAAHNNWGELQYCLKRLEAQTFTDWQHVIIHDGPNPKMRERLYHRGYAAHGKRVFVELGRNWHGFMGGDDGPTPAGYPGARGGRGSRGASAYMVANYLASGEYIAYCDSDCEFLPDHLEISHSVLKSTGADFTYTQVQRNLDGRLLDIIGNGQPNHGTIDGNAVVHKASLLPVVNWRWGGDADWDFIGRLLLNGAGYAFIPEVTVLWNHASNDI